MWSNASQDRGQPIAKTGTPMDHIIKMRSKELLLKFFLCEPQVTLEIACPSAGMRMIH